jgi:hypothetical protein
MGTGGAHDPSVGLCGRHLPSYAGEEDADPGENYMLRPRPADLNAAEGGPRP